MVHADLEQRVARVIEQSMIFALGFLMSGLFALLLLPAVWRRALRLSRARLERHLPLSLAEIAAERDRLRAEFAVERRRLEQANEALVEQRAKNMAEIGRLGARIADMTRDLETQRSSASDVQRELAPVRRDAEETAALAGALEKEVHDATALAETRLEQLADMQTRHAAAAALAAEQRLDIARLQNRIEALEGALESARREVEALRERLSRTRAPDPEGDAQLRQAIATLGADILKLTHARATAASESPTLEAAPTPADSARSATVA